MKKLFNKEVIMYLIFGVLTTVVSWGTYTVFVNLCKMSVLSKSCQLGVCRNFCLHHKQTLGV